MIIYLSGPMTGLPDFNYPAFHAAAAILRGTGYRVENPAENSPPPCGTWAGWMRLALAQLRRCTHVALLPGWQHSRGAKIEVHAAVRRGMIITPVHVYSSLPRRPIMTPESQKQHRADRSAAVVEFQITRDGGDAAARKAGAAVARIFVEHNHSACRAIEMGNQAARAVMTAIH